MTISLPDPCGMLQGVTDRDLRVRAEGTATERMAMLTAPAKPSQEMRCLLPGYELVIKPVFELPVWVAPTVQGLKELLDLPSDWNSYGARAVAPSHVDAALQVLSRIMRHDTPAPAVVPTNRGGVQLEWHTGGIDLEIETFSTQRLLVSFEDATTGTEWEKEIDGDLTLLVECIGRLS